VAAGTLRLIRYDQPGHGRSTWADGEISIDQLGTDLGELIDRLAPDGPVVLGGHSMGGMTIMALAACRPELFGDRVRGVALVSTAAGDLDPEPRTAAEKLQRRLTPGALNLALAGARVVERLRRMLPPTSPRHQKMVRNLLYGADATDAMVLAGAEIMHASTVRAFTAFLPAIGEHDKRSELAALSRVPVEILVGDSDKLTPNRHSRVMAEALPDAVLHIVERTGHMLPQERPTLAADAIGRLLDAAAGDGRGA
jgi:pimeloyl-ACP methyl ester carboxylesterase